MDIKTKLDKIVLNTRRNSPHPVIAVISSSAQGLQDGDVVTGKGATSFDAVWNAYGMALLRWQVKKHWAAKVYCMDADGNLLEPTHKNSMQWIF